MSDEQTTKLTSVAETKPTVVATVEDAAEPEVVASGTPATVLMMEEKVKKEKKKGKGKGKKGKKSKKNKKK